MVRSFTNSSNAKKLTMISVLFCDSSIISKKWTCLLLLTIWRMRSIFCFIDMALSMVVCGNGFLGFSRLTNRTILCCIRSRLMFSGQINPSACRGGSTRGERERLFCQRVFTFLLASTKALYRRSCASMLNSSSSSSPNWGMRPRDFTSNNFVATTRKSASSSALFSSRVSRCVKNCSVTSPRASSLTSSFFSARRERRRSSGPLNCFNLRFTIRV